MEEKCRSKHSTMVNASSAYNVLEDPEGGAAVFVCDSGTQIKREQIVYLAFLNS